MLLLGFLLIPMVLATDRQLNINSYIVNIKNDALQSIKKTSQSTDELNLSNLHLESIKNNVFDKLKNIKIINLSKNTLQEIPEFLFANQTNLEHLNLGENEISNLKNVFLGLGHLKSVNLSYNYLESLERGSFHGLPKSSDIFIARNQLGSINTGIFENPTLKNKMPPVKTVEEMHADVGFKYNPAIYGPSAISTRKSSTDDKNRLQPLEANVRVKMCIQEGKVKSLEALKKDEILGSDCREIVVVHSLRKLILREQNIKEFESGWYRLHGFPINEIDLDGNQIARVTPDLLNDLPADLKKVTLNKNKIERLAKGIIENEHLNTLELNFNFIREIEAGAFEKMNLTDGLHLGSNRLKDTKFAATLPTNLTILSLKDNEISEIAAGSFSKLGKLSRLDLNFNNISTIGRQSLQGLQSLRYLLLTDNRLRSIESGAFEDLVFLRILDVAGNLMSSLQKDLFTGLDILLALDISRNKFSEITPETMAGLPGMVHFLSIDQNGIESLKTRSFVGAPILELSLRGNNISKIDKGAFNLPNLRSLSLRDNPLGKFDGDMFEGLKALGSLSLAGTGITKVEKGAVKNLGNLNKLDLSFNSIKELKNGALYGLQTSGSREIYVIDNPIELIQGGLFDDVL